MNPWQYRFYCFDLLYGITSGFDITLDLLLMPWNFKDILRCLQWLGRKKVNGPVQISMGHGIKCMGHQWVSISKPV